MEENAAACQQNARATNGSLSEELGNKQTKTKYSKRYIAGAFPYNCFENKPCRINATRRLYRSHRENTYFRQHFN